MDRTGREDIQEEYAYHAAGNVDPESAKKGGHQVGADFVLRGEIASDTQRGDREQVQWYIITLKLTDITKGTIAWQGQEEIKKYSRKPRMGVF